MASEYDALLAEPPVDQKSPYDVLLAQPSPAPVSSQTLPNQSREAVRPTVSLPNLTASIFGETAGRTVQNAQEAGMDVVRGIPSMIESLPGMAYQGLKFAAGGPQEKAQVIEQAAAEALPQGRQIAQDVESPLGSRESFRGLASLGMLAAPMLTEAIFGRVKPEIPVEAEKPPVQPETPSVSEATKAPATPTLPETTVEAAAKEVAPQQGFVRLYHGSSADSPQAGRDFTTSRQYAEDYAAKAEGGVGGKVWSVDVPEGSLKTHDEYGQPMTRVVVPDEVANQAKPVSLQGEAPVAQGNTKEVTPTAETPTTSSEVTQEGQATPAFQYPQEAWDSIKQSAERVRKENPSHLVTVSPSLTNPDYSRINYWDNRGIVSHLEIPTEKVEAELQQSTYPRGGVILSIEGGIGGTLPSANYAGMGFHPSATGTKGVKSFVGPKENMDWMQSRLESGGYKVSVKDVPENVPEKSGQSFFGENGKPVRESGLETQPVSGGGQPPSVSIKPKETGVPPQGQAAPEPRTTGIAQRITGVEAGEGMSPEETVNRGRELLSQGANPEEISARIKSTKQISADDISVLRAKEEDLTKSVYSAGDLAKANPSDPVAQQEFKSALEARNQWREEHVKPAQTQWSDIGRAQQGETDIDTGTFTGLRMAFMDTKGRDATIPEQAKLTDLADKTQQATASVDQTKANYDQAIASATKDVPLINPEEIHQHFIDRITDPNAKSFNFTQPEVASIWKYAKDNYIDKGVTSLDDTIHGIALDTGLKPEWVADALTKPKAIKQITNELYARMAARRNMVNAAKDYINAKDEPMWKKVAKAVWETPFSVAIYGHGTVGGITHAGANIFRPSIWKAYWPDFVNQAKFFARPGIHEAAMQTLVRDPNFITGKRAGLANDPNLTYTDYGAYANFFGLQGGRRGFDALKTMRQSMFNSMWDKVPDSVKSDPAASKEMARGYADMVNHATGVISTGDRGFLATAARAGSSLAFAAKLEASRWARVIGDPLKTLDTYARWNEATPTEKSVALKRTRNAAEFAAGFVGTLYLNQAILSASGSKEKINFTDPSKSDWLKHKIAGHAVAVDGGLLSPIRLLGRLTYDTLVRPRKELHGDTRTTAAIKDIGQYAVGKAAPSISIAKEAITAESFDGRLLPWSRDTSKKPRMTWTEYATSHGPIPLSGATKDIYDSMRERGMSTPDAKAVLRGLAAFGSELTGARVTEAPEERLVTVKENKTKAPTGEDKTPLNP